MIPPEVTSLFKYRPINQFSLDIIANERIYFPVPESFNDPFDTKCSFKKKSTIIQSTDVKKIKNAFPGEGPGDILAYTKKDLTEEIDNFEQKLKNYGVLSLAENAKDILMWSHYSENHKGLCIEFERNESNELGDKTKTKNVNYTKNYPSLSPKALLSTEDIESSLIRVLYTKSEHWSYEKEWRMFVPKGNKVYPIPGIIKSVTFGVRASDMDIDIVRQLLTGKDVVLYKALLKENEFGIKLKISHNRDRELLK
jgi:hypothetical protein